MLLSQVYCHRFVYDRNLQVNSMQINLIVNGESNSNICFFIIYSSMNMFNLLEIQSFKVSNFFTSFKSLNCV